MKKLLLLIALALPLTASAFDGKVQIDGIYYNIVTKAQTAEVAPTGSSYSNYSGDIVIPETVEYEGVVCNVVSIAEDAFHDSGKLTSVSIPNSVTKIGKEAFRGCSKLTAIVIPDGVTRIEGYTFIRCTNLVSVTLPKDLTYIGVSAFANCEKLESITIPQSLKEIGAYAFNDCTSLTAVHISDLKAWCDIKCYETGLSGFVIFNNPWDLYLNGEKITDLVIPEGVETINNGMFLYCNIATVSIPYGVTSIGDSAFRNCQMLTSVVVPEGVTSIGYYSFKGCTGLTTVTLPGSLKEIKMNAFEGCAEIVKLYCYAEKCPTTGSDVFKDCRTEYATLYVPTASVTTYRAKSPWSNFKEILSLTGDAVDAKCAKPTIDYKDGKLTFNCATEGAEIHYSFANVDMKSGTGTEVKISRVYTVSAYASKAGYENSDTATMDLSGFGITGDTNADGVVNAADIVVIVNIIMATK